MLLNLLINGEAESVVLGAQPTFQAAVLPKRIYVGHENPANVSQQGGLDRSKRFSQSRFFCAVLDKTDESTRRPCLLTF